MNVSSVSRRHVMWNTIKTIQFKTLPTPRPSLVQDMEMKWNRPGNIPIYNNCQMVAKPANPNLAKHYRIFLERVCLSVLLKELCEDSGNNWDHSKGQEDYWVLLVRGHSNASSVWAVICGGHCGSEDGGDDDHHKVKVGVHFESWNTCYWIVWLFQESGKVLIIFGTLFRKQRLFEIEN